MKSEILRATLSRAPAERTVTILGATGSIGASTVDLLKRERKRFRIEAVSANKNAEPESRRLRAKADCSRRPRGRRNG